MLKLELCACLSSIVTCLLFIWQLVWKNNCDIMIFVKAVTVNCIFEVILWCFWRFPSFFCIAVHFKSCARRVGNVRVGCFSDNYLKVIIFHCKELLSRLHEFNALYIQLSFSFISFLNWTLNAMNVYNRSCNNFHCSALLFENRIYEAFLSLSVSAQG